MENNQKQNKTKQLIEEMFVSFCLINWHCRKIFVDFVVFRWNFS